MEKMLLQKNKSCINPLPCSSSIYNIRTIFSPLSYVFYVQYYQLKFTLAVVSRIWFIIVDLSNWAIAHWSLKVRIVSERKEISNYTKNTISWDQFIVVIRNVDKKKWCYSKKCGKDYLEISTAKSGDTRALSSPFDSRLSRVRK